MNDGKAYGRLFEARQQADYLTRHLKASSFLSDDTKLVDELQRLLGRTHGNVGSSNEWAI
jgi:hypothetical protein